MKAVQTQKYGVKDFLKSMNKATKLLLKIGTPLIISLFCGGVFLELYIFTQGYFSEIARLADELIRCCGDCLAAVYIPAIMIEFVKRDKE